MTGRKLHQLPHIDALRREFRIDAHWRLERYTKASGWKRCSKRYGGSDYFTVCIDNKTFGAHRVIWTLHYGKPPEGIIDHINGQPWDNRIENMRDVSYSQNRMNTLNTRVNKNGYPNVFSRWGSFSARVVRNGKMYCSPAFDDPELAALAAQEMIRRYHGEYARQAA